MQRRSFLKKAAVGAAVGTVAAPAIAQSQPSIQWRMAASWPKSLDTLFGGAELVAKRVGEIDRRQVPDSRLCRRRDRAGAASARCGAGRHRRAGPHRDLTTTSARTRRSRSAAASRFGLNTRQSNAWWYFGGGAEAMAPLFKDYGCIAMLAGNTGCQMGGWFRKEIKSRRRPEGPQVAHRRHGGPGAGQARRGAAADRRARHLSGAREGHHRRRRMGGPVRRREARLQQGRQVLLLPRLVGRRPDADAARQREEVERAAQELPGGAEGRLRRSQHAGCRPSTTRRIPPALRRLVASGTKLRPFPEVSDGGLRESSLRAVRGAQARRARTSSASIPQWKKFRDEQFLWFRVAESTYDNYAFYLASSARK